MTDWQLILEFVQTLTTRVGEKLLNDFSHLQVQAYQKQDGSLVTASDRWADEQIKSALLQQFPSYGVLSEESDRILPNTEWCWIVDPLDGTTNFARGIPIWGISLGLLHRGMPIFGYIHFPPLQQSFYGWFSSDPDMHTPPNSAFLNGKPIFVDKFSGQDSFGSNHFFSSCSRSLEAMATVQFPCKLRMLGAATYNLLTVATGATVGAVEATPKIWDIAAVWAIAQAAGTLWLPLESRPIFPLEAGQDYASRSFPTLILSHADLMPNFRPLVEPLFRL